MIHDKLLTFALNQRPQIAQGGLGLPFVAAEFYTFPLGALTVDGAVSFDLKVPADGGDGRPLKARFNIKESFVAIGGQPTIARFGIAASNDPGFAGTDQVELAVGHPLTIAELTAGSFYELTVPRLSTIHGPGRRFLFLGMVLTTTQVSPNPLFSAGGVDAFLLLDAQRDLPIAYPSGWSAK